MRDRHGWEMGQFYRTVTRGGWPTPRHKYKNQQTSLARKIYTPVWKIRSIGDTCSATVATMCHVASTDFGFIHIYNASKAANGGSLALFIYCYLMTWQWQVTKWSTEGDYTCRSMGGFWFRICLCFIVRMLMKQHVV